ncbi:MAG TPA: xanthine dehydrogenase family protein molybdopterin-binding subunit [Thermoanaerobaculia bacterium]|nr:xanthine dehydrogenase family protein molybdopterin-binding subunit [Thermoanaerobaculia bacterium]
MAEHAEIARLAQLAQNTGSAGSPATLQTPVTSATAAAPATPGTPATSATPATAGTPAPAGTPAAGSPAAPATSGTPAPAGTPAAPEPTWPDAASRRLIGKRISRLDGPAKATGAAKYTYDVHRPGMLYGKVLRCPHAHARVKKLDLSRTEKAPGVKAVLVLHGEGSEIQWALDEVAAVAATSEQMAADALRAAVVEYELLPHFVSEEVLENAPKTKPGEEQLVGDPEKAMAGAAVRVKGHYGLPVVAHNCLEAHGQICEWKGDNLTAWCSTQAVSAAATQFAEQLGISAANVEVITEYMGGGFGSKFNIDSWGPVCAKLARQAGAPVRLMLERDAELTVAGDRPSAFADIEVGAAADGALVAWVSKSWGSGGLGGAGSPPLPYIFEIPNRRHRHTSVPTNTAASRAWRAPNHPQACLLTFAALDDTAAALGMDPLAFVTRNLALAGARARAFGEELVVAERLMDWKARWRPRGAGGSTPGTVRRGLGLALQVWGGRGHASHCDVTVYPDGGVEAKLSTQDLGTGTRTVVAIVLAETFGLPLEAVKVRIGDSRLPASGGSGGSTTVGGVSSSTRRAALNALDLVFAKVAPRLGAAAPGELEAADGVVRVKAHPERRLPWRQAAAALGVSPVTASGANPGPGKLTDSGTAGVTMADVEVDVETGLVAVLKMVAVQEGGLIIDAKTAESQVYGGLIMGVSYALAEEKVIDPVSGRMLNVDFDGYKLAGIADVGELVVHLMSGPGYDERGVIGMGEPTVIGPGAAISNAVANAIGVRVPQLPLTPDRVLDALEKGRAA